MSRWFLNRPSVLQLLRQLLGHANAHATTCFAMLMPSTTRRLLSLLLCAEYSRLLKLAGWHWQLYRARLLGWSALLCGLLMVPQECDEGEASCDCCVAGLMACITWAHLRRQKEWQLQSWPITPVLQVVLPSQQLSHVFDAACRGCVHVSIMCFSLWRLLGFDNFQSLSCWDMSSMSNHKGSSTRCCQMQE